MTRPSRPSRFREGTVAVAFLVLAVVAHPRRAVAQACCAGGTVVTPTRLALHEDVAVGVELRARTNPGSFDANGHYTSSSGVEQILEQDFAASARVAGKGQVGAVLPMIQTHRNVDGIDDWGGGLGDVSLTARYDFLLAAQSLYWPGFGVLAASTIPTGTPPDKASPSHPLAADATGAGTYDVTVGLDVEKVAGHVYAALNGWLTHRFARTLSVGDGPSLTESFSVRWTLLAVAGYVFDSDAALGVYVSALDEGPATINGVQDPTTMLRLTTVGAAGVLPVRDLWRLQGALFSDVTATSFGRNEPVGYGLTASLVRVWLHPRRALTSPTKSSRSSSRSQAPVPRPRKPRRPTSRTSFSAATNRQRSTCSQWCASTN